MNQGLTYLLSAAALGFQTCVLLEPVFADIALFWIDVEKLGVGGIDCGTKEGVEFFHSFFAAESFEVSLLSCEAIVNR